MRAVLCCALASFFASCTWLFPEPTPRWPAPSGFGERVWEGAMLRAPTYDAVVSGDRVFVSILEANGRDTNLQRVETPTLTMLSVSPSGTTPLPASPLSAAPTRLWPASGGVIAVQGARAVRFDAAAWVELPTLPVTAPDFLLGLGDAVLLRTGPQLFVLGQGTWRAIPVAAQASSAVFGPGNSTEVRVVFTGIDGLCTTRVTLADLSSTAPSCLANQTELLSGEALNGTLDDFHAWARDVVDLQLWHFSAGQWRRGSRARGERLRWTPDAAFAVASIDVTGTIPLQNLTRVVGGRSTEALFVQSWELLGCDGELRTCARTPGFIRELVASDGSEALFLIENLVDARRSLYLKRVPLPHRDSGDCTPACAAGLLCTRASGIANLCVADPSR
ncbi:MAG: hypothetical protein JNM17_05185 [Archangium sp.]|nr:hypothetical protein [Archangium sp.]